MEIITDEHNVFLAIAYYQSINEKAYRLRIARHCMLKVIETGRILQTLRKNGEIKYDSYAKTWRINL